MAETDSGKFWRGPIASVAQAQKIISVTGWVFSVFGIFILLSTLTDAAGTGQRGLAGGVFTFLILAGPGGFLLTRRNRTPAYILFAVCLFAGLVSLAIGVTAPRAEVGVKVATAAVVLFWALLALLCWRAIRAASALPRLKAQGTIDLELPLRIRSTKYQKLVVWIFLPIAIGLVALIAWGATSLELAQGAKDYAAARPTPDYEQYFYFSLGGATAVSLFAAGLVALGLEFLILRSRAPGRAARHFVILLVTAMVTMCAAGLPMKRAFASMARVQQLKIHDDQQSAADARAYQTAIEASNLAGVLDPASPNFTADMKGVHERIAAARKAEADHRKLLEQRGAEGRDRYVAAMAGGVRPAKAAEGLAAYDAGIARRSVYVRTMEALHDDIYDEMDAALSVLERHRQAWRVADGRYVFSDANALAEFQARRGRISVLVQKELELREAYAAATGQTAGKASE